MPALNSSCMEEPRSFMWKNLRPAPLDQLLLLHGRALQTKTYRSIAAPSPIAPAVRLAGELVASSAEVCRSRPCRSENVILRWSVPFVLADNVMHASRGSMSWLQQVEARGPDCENFSQQLLRPRRCSSSARQHITQRLKRLLKCAHSRQCVRCLPGSSSRSTCSTLCPCCCCCEHVNGAALVYLVARPFTAP